MEKLLELAKKNCDWAEVFYIKKGLIWTVGVGMGVSMGEVACLMVVVVAVEIGHGR